MAPRRDGMIRSDVSGSVPYRSTGGKTAPVGGGKASMGLGLGRSMGGKGQAKRHRKILRDNIKGVTKGDIRRLARRGGVKRISGMIYNETRFVMRSFLETILKDICAVTEVCGRKTVMVEDIIYALRRQGRTLYGFGEPAR
ncbi:histone-fold-containing protein [Teratosphaeria nubilosa]|uniref:Histone H4 n=1 Tax=Teratosphaeria nubilosa TaxID=161662 RepID=A0A6G1KWG8_9PEZI|nr:histone-fold-containing protein [Teratosphaeria nubilosa]